LGGFLGGKTPECGTARVRGRTLLCDDTRLRETTWLCGTALLCDGVRAGPVAPVGVPLPKTTIAAVANAAVASRLTRNADATSIAQRYPAITRRDLSDLRYVLVGCTGPSARLGVPGHRRG